jgi:hypothetical protein
VFEAISGRRWTELTAACRAEDHVRMEERRLHRRQLTCIPAYFEARSESQDVALIRDASVTGAKLYTRVKVDLDQAVTLHLYLGGESATPRQATGRVVRVERRDPDQSDVWRWEVGVEFDEPITPYEDEIEELCRRQEAAGILKR